MIKYILLALRSIGTLAYNPILGRTQLEAEKISKLTDLLSFYISQGEAFNEELKAFARQIQVMAEQGIDPNETQWEAIAQRDKAARASLAENKARLLQEQAEEKSSETEGPAPVASGEGVPEESPSEASEEGPQE